MKTLEHIAVMGKLPVSVTFLSPMCSPGVTTLLPTGAFATTLLPGALFPLLSFLGPSHNPDLGKPREGMELWAWDLGEAGEVPKMQSPRPCAPPCHTNGAQKV